MKKYWCITDYFKCNDLLSSVPPPPGISQSCIKSVREELTVSPKSSLDETSDGKKRGEYNKFTPKEKAIIAEYASRNGIAACLRHFKRNGEYTDLKESTVRGKELSSRKRDLSGGEIVELPEKCRGRPLLVGDEAETKVRWFLSTIRQAGGIVNYHIAIATARGVIKSKNSNLLVQNGGHMDINKDWAKRLLGRMNLVKRRMTTKAKLCPTNFVSLLCMGLVLQQS